MKAVNMESPQNVKCADTDLLSVSCKLAYLSLHDIGECLGLQKSQVDDVLKRVSEHHQEHNKAHLLLMKWQEVNEDGATWDTLIQCMESLPNSQIVDSIKGEPQKKALYSLLILKHQLGTKMLEMFFEHTFTVFIQ